MKTFESTNQRGGASMHSTRISAFSLLVLAMLVAGISQNLFANSTVGLCAGPGTHYTTISAAVAAAVAGSTIDVCPGTYPEQVAINKDLTLAGVKSGTSDAAVIVPPTGGLVQNGTDIFGNPVAAQIFVAAASVTIKGLTVDGTGNNIAGCGPPALEGIYFKNTSGTISENAVRNQFQTDFADFGGCQNGLAINVESISSTNTVTISSNSVRAYQKNGITASGAGTPGSPAGPSVKISGNYIVGLAAAAMNWPTSGAAENGIQVGFGATGSVSGNAVNDNIWAQDTSSQPGNAASGILVFASTGISVTSNEVGSAQFGVAIETDPASDTFCNGASCGPADNATVTGNKVVGTQIFDAIDLCSSGNTAKSNFIFGSTESGIHVDDGCGTGNNNIVTNNLINEACAGILTGTGSGNTVGPNTFSNVTNTTLAGDACPAAPGGASASVVKAGASKGQQSLRPSPYRPNAK